MRFSVAFTGFGAMKPMVELAQAADDLGFDGVFSAEHIGGHDGIVPSAILLGATGLDVGIVGLSPASRHPGVLAMELSSLSEYGPGRVRVQVGTGDAGMLSTIGVKVPRPLTTVPRFVRHLKDATSGRRMKAQEELYSFNNLKLTPMGPPLPVDVMAVRPKMIRMACEVADGLSISVAASIQYLRETVQEVEAHLAELGRDRASFRITAIVTTSVADDIDVARGPVLGIASLGDAETIAHLGRGVLERTALVDAVAKGGALGMRAAIPAEALDETALVATPATLPERLAAFASTGVDELSMLLVGDPTNNHTVLKHLSQAIAQLPR